MSKTKSVLLSDWSKLRPNPNNFQTRTSTEMYVEEPLGNQDFVTMNDLFKMGN